jgi:hypothetical protein
MAVAKKNKRGRPLLPKDKRTARRVVARLYPKDDALLRELCDALDVSEAEVIRRALHALADGRGKRPNKRG